MPSGFVCSGEGFRLRDVVEMVSKELGISPKITIDLERVRPNEIMYVVENNTKSKKEFGWSSVYTLRETLKGMIREFSEV